MKVNFIRNSYTRFYNSHKKEIDQALSKSLSKGSLIMESEVEKLEKNFARFCKRKYCITTASGTDALMLASKIKEPTLKQQYRYRLDLPTTDIIRMKDGAMNLVHLENGVRERECLLITYMNSVQPDLKELKRLKKERKLFIIEDACQAVGRELIGDISCFSFYPAKMIGGMGKGGALVTDNEKVYKTLKKIRDDKWNNIWLDEIKASFLNVRLKYLPTLLKRRKEISKMYNEGLKCKILSKDCLQNYIILEGKYKLMIKYLRSRGVEAISDDNNFYEGNIKNGIRLPIYSELTNREVNYVISCVNNFYDKK